MAKYKITKVSVVVASSKAEAARRAEAAPDETLEYLSIVEQAPEQANGFPKGVRMQVVGT